MSGMTIHLGCLLPNTSSNLPEQRCGKSPFTRYIERIKCRSYLVLLPTGFTMPSLLPCSRCALTAPSHLFLFLKRGSLFSAALSVEVLRPLPGVTRRRFSVKPGLSSPSRVMQRPSDFFDGSTMRTLVQNINLFPPCPVRFFDG